MLSKVMSRLRLPSPVNSFGTANATRGCIAFRRVSKLSTSISRNLRSATSGRGSAALAGKIRHHAHHERQLDLLLGAVQLDVVLDLHARRTIARDEFLTTLLGHATLPVRFSLGLSRCSNHQFQRGIGAAATRKRNVNSDGEPACDPVAKDLVTIAFVVPGAAVNDQTSARQMNAFAGRIGRTAVGHRRSGVIGENAVECGHDRLAGGFDPAGSRRTRSIQSPAASCAFASVCPLRSVRRIYTIGKTHTRHAR